MSYLVKSGQVSPTTLARLKSQLQMLGILHERVAMEASKTSRRGTVSASAVSRVLAGRTKSANVVATARRLIAEAKAQPPTGREPSRRLVHRPIETVASL